MVTDGPGEGHLVMFNSNQGFMPSEFNMEPDNWGPKDVFVKLLLLLSRKLLQRVPSKERYTFSTSPVIYVF